MLTAIFTTINDDGSESEIVLDLQSKGAILKHLKQHLVSPQKYKLSVREDYSELEEKTEAKDLVTLAEWLLEKNIELSKTNKHQLASLVAKMYKERYHKVPRVIARPDNKGRYIKKAYGFDADELGLLQDALNELKKRTVVETKPASATTS